VTNLNFPKFQKNLKKIFQKIYYKITIKMPKCDKINQTWRFGAQTPDAQAQDHANFSHAVQHLHASRHHAVLALLQRHGTAQDVGGSGWVAVLCGARSA
jgi:hypothetical protein